jgi:hypothetical protein
MKLPQKLLIMTAIAYVMVCCSQVPKEAITTATKARENAKANEADIYAKNSFAAAETLITEMNEDVANKSFDKAKKLALDAAAAFDDSALAAKKQRDEIANSIPGLEKKASDELQAVEEIYAKNKAALKTKKVDINAIMSDLQAFKNALTEAQGDITNMKFMDAKIKLDGILAKLLEDDELMKKTLSK